MEVNSAMDEERELSTCAGTPREDEIGMRLLAPVDWNIFFICSFYSVLHILSFFYSSVLYFLASELQLFILFLFLFSSFSFYSWSPFPLRL